MGTWARIIQSILVKTGSFKEKRVFGGLWSLEVQKYHRGESNNACQRWTWMTALDNGRDW